jgi:hypothetical protein
MHKPMTHSTKLRDKGHRKAYIGYTCRSIGRTTPGTRILQSDKFIEIIQLAKLWLFCSAFHLTLHICSISSYAFSPFPFLTVSFFSHTEQPTTHSLSHLLLYTPTRRFNFPTPYEKTRQLSKKLKHQLIVNHESVR